MLLYKYKGSDVMKKNLIIGIGMFLLVCIGSYLIYHYTAEEKNKLGVTTVSFEYEIDLLENMGIVEYQIGNYIFKKSKVNYGDGTHSFEATIVSAVDTDYDILDIIIYDEEGNVLDTIEYEFVGVFADEERYLFCVVTEDLSKASYFEVTMKE